MPPTEKQLTANRANAAKSTGPKTPDGRRNSSRNSTRHGILASVVLIEGESQERFTALLNSLYTEHQPETSTEKSLVDKMAVSLWRQMRTWAVESAGISHEMKLQSDSMTDEDGATRAMLAIRSLGDSGRHLDLMSRYDHRFDRQHYRAIAALNNMKDRKIATRSQFFEENKGQPKGDAASQPPVEPKNDPV